MVTRSGSTRVWFDINDVVREVLALARTELHKHDALGVTPTEAGSPPPLFPASSKRHHRKAKRKAGKSVPSAAESFARDGPELLATVNPTFTWVRLAQRIPVRIRLTDVPEDELISAGMTCTVILNDASKPHFGTGVKHVMAALF
jgi:hypothetical protein